MLKAMVANGLFLILCTQPVMAYSLPTLRSATPCASASSIPLAVPHANVAEPVLIPTERPIAPNVPPEGTNADSAALAQPSAQTNQMRDRESVVACSTCGCSEITPVALLETSVIRRKDTSLLSNSLWGNLILDMAYQRDPELKRLAHKLGFVNGFTLATIGIISGVTIGQGISSLATLNPPEGHIDSYVPGAIGLVASGATVLTLGTRVALNRSFRKKIQQRQSAIRDEVDSVLRHLRYSDNCVDARKDLETLIGELGASEFLDLWHTTHVKATLLPKAPDSAPVDSSLSLPATPSTANSSVTTN